MKIKKLSRLNFNDLVRQDNIGYFEYDIIPDIPVSNLDTFYIVKDGDRLDLISYKFYNTVDLGWAILVANNIKYFGDIRVGDKIRIPSFSVILDLLQKSYVK